MKINGRKTYAVAVLMALYAVAGLLLEKVSPGAAWSLVLEAAAIAGLRHGVSKVK